MSIVPKDITDIGKNMVRCKGSTLAVHNLRRLYNCGLSYADRSMCNLYSMTSSQDAIIDLVKVWRDDTGNLPALPGIYPDYPAPVVTQTPEGRVMRMMRWGMPSPAFVLKDKKTDKGVTNVRNTASPHWRRWLGPSNRCVVPFTSFSEYQTVPGHPPKPVWFGPTGPQKVLFFAGIWTEWTSVRKLKEGEVTCDLFAFLTVDPNGVVKPYHPKAMPVILRSPEAIAHWLQTDVDAALKLQRPFPDDGIEVIEDPI